MIMCIVLTNEKWINKKWIYEVTNRQSKTVIPSMKHFLCFYKKKNVIVVDYMIFNS